MATSSPAMRSSVSSTKNFFVRVMSRNAAQNGLSDQAMPMLPVTSAISVSECPTFLNIVPQTQIAIANGIPSDRYDVGTQNAGCLMGLVAGEGAVTLMASVVTLPAEQRETRNRRTPESRGRRS